MKQLNLKGFAKRGRPPKKRKKKSATKKKYNGSGAKGTYLRKYYLHREIKKAGFSLSLEQTIKSINVPHNLVELAAENKYVSELQNNHNYGVQTSIV